MTENTMAPSDPVRLRKFGFLMSFVFGGIFGLLIPLLKHRDIPVWPWIVTAFFLLPALIYPKLLGPVERAWMWIGHKLGIINSTLILSAVYFVLVTPIGVIFKLLGRDSMNRKWNSSAGTYRKPMKDSDPASRMGVPF